MNTTGTRSLYAAAMLTLAGGIISISGCDGERSSDGHAVHPGSLPEESTARVAVEKIGADHVHGSTEEAPGVHTHTTRLEFSADPAVLPAGNVATWSLRVVDQASGDPVEEFDMVHEKLMHLIVISSDLSWFNHLHPQYHGDGMFTVRTTLPRAGSYKLYADYTPKGGAQEVAQYEFSAGGGQTAPTSVSPVADSVGAGGWMLALTNARTEGEPDAPGGGEYEVAMMPMPSAITAGRDVMLHFQVRDASGEPVNDLQPYLGEMGHAVLLSSDTKTYLHTHPMAGGAHGTNHGGHHSHDDVPSRGGSDVVFHTNFPVPGFYKVWGQFQHRGKIITAPFVLKVTEA